MNKIKKSYRNYRELRKELKNRTYNLLNDSIGQYDKGKFISIDITIREYDDKWCIDYDIYKLRKGCENYSYLAGGLVCNVSNMPFTEKGFWKLVIEKVTKEINIISKIKCCYKV